MARQRLTSTASSGQSEVLRAMRDHGARHSGIDLGNIGVIVSRSAMGDENRAGSDAQFEADVLTVLQALQGLGFVQAHDAITGATVDLAGITGLPPAAPTRVVLTDAGQLAARHPRPRRRVLRG